MAAFEHPTDLRLECVWPLGAELGEGPVWSAREQAVWFVDIKKFQIHRFDPRSGDRRSWDTPSAPGFLAPTAGGGWVVGLKSGLHLFDADTGCGAQLAEVEPQSPHNRLNDGCVDRNGRLWFGSMHDGETDATGALYRLEADGAVSKHDAGYVITNGPAFSPDGATIYHTDTLKRLIYAFDLAGDGSIQNRRVFASIQKAGAYPDGPAVDAEGCVWTGLFGGWGLNRYAPDGEFLGHIPFPCANVTKPVFGGEDLKSLYVTTARKGLSAEAQGEQPLAGGLFRVAVDTPGLPQDLLRLDRS